MPKIKACLQLHKKLPENSLDVIFVANNGPIS